MKIRNVVHEGLCRFIEDDDAASLQSDFASKVRRIVSFLQDMEREDELRAVPSWKPNQLTGDERGVWSLFVTTGWRLTFQIDQSEIIDLDFRE